MELDFSPLRGIEGDAPAGRGRPEASPLQREVDRLAEERQDALAVYQAYQRDIVRTEGLRAALLKGAKAGEDARVLLLMAAEAISLTTGDALFYEQMKRDVGV